MIRRPPRSTLFPYTTLFRSDTIEIRLVQFVRLFRGTLLQDYPTSGPGFLGDIFRFRGDRKSTRLNSSHSQISYAVFCLKKKKTNTTTALYPYRDCTSNCGHT